MQQVVESFEGFLEFREIVVSQCGFERGAPRARIQLARDRGFLERLAGRPGESDCGCQIEPRRNLIRFQITCPFQEIDRFRVPLDVEKGQSESLFLSQYGDIQNARGRLAIREQQQAFRQDVFAPMKNWFQEVNLRYQRESRSRQQHRPEA